ncbi:DedA family protein [Paenibacillus sp. S-38]|uniref:DedA family protein n=1 Tax=Paenibacillus sp. S-38 TaxID=3416710 RepID=UPI003CFA1196
MEHLLQYINQYGYIALYGLLALGIVGIPVPDEILMTTVGTLTAANNPVLHFGTTLLVSFLGAMTGMMLSYTLGRTVGKPFLYKYGRWVKLTPERLSVAEGWFKKYGMWAVFFGYYVPGVRHFTCYLAGVSNVSIWRYLLYAASGALVWVTTFLTLGHVIGTNAIRLINGLHHHMALPIILILILAAGIILYIRYRRRKKSAFGSSE